MFPLRVLLIFLCSLLTKRGSRRQAGFKKGNLLTMPLRELCSYSELSYCNVDHPFQLACLKNIIFSSHVLLFVSWGWCSYQPVQEQSSPVQCQTSLMFRTTWPSWFDVAPVGFRQRLAGALLQGRRALPGEKHTMTALCVSPKVTMSLHAKKPCWEK